MTATAPAYTSVATADGGASGGTAFSITLPAGLANGDVGYLAVVLNTQNDRGDPGGGWGTPIVFEVNGTVLQLKVYRKVLTAAESSTAVAFTLSNSQKWSAVVTVVSGDNDLDTDTELWSTASASSSWTAGAVTPTVSSALLMNFHAFRRAATGTVTQTAPTGWDERGEACASASASPTVACGANTGVAPAAGVSSGTDSDGGTNASCSHQISYTLIVKPAVEALSGTISSSGTASAAVAGAKQGSGAITSSGTASCSVDGEGAETGGDTGSGPITSSGSPSCTLAGGKQGRGVLTSTGSSSCTIAGGGNVSGAITSSGTASCTLAGRKAGLGVITSTGTATCVVTSAPPGVQVPPAVRSRPSTPGGVRPRPAPGAGVRPSVPTAVRVHSR